jgi:vesicle transport through interaction with t-SNAREs protein 1
VGLVEADIAEAEALIRRMDLEARSLQNPAIKTPLLEKLRDYKAELARLKRESAVAAKAASAAVDRSQLLASASLDDANAPTSMSQRDRMLQATARLDQTGDRIREGKRGLLETEELGVSILQDLHRQRETIVSARENVHGTDDNIGRSRKILAAMGRRAMANKVMMYGIIAMLVSAILVIAYFKLIK